MSQTNERRKHSLTGSAPAEPSLSLFHHLPAAIWILDRASLKFIEANEAALDLYGYSRKDFVGKSLFEISAPEQTSLLLNGAEEKMDLQPGAIFEHKHVSGRLLTVEVTLRRAQINGRDVWLGVTREIDSTAAHKSMIRHIRDSQRLIRSFLDAEPQFVTHLDRDGKILNMNHAGLKVLGCSYDDVRTKAFEQWVGAAYRSLFCSALSRVLQGETASLQFEIHTSAGDLRLLDSNSVPIRNSDGQVTSVLAIARDITERRRAQDRLVESERRFKTVFGEAPIGICLVAPPDGRFLQVNRAFAKLVGYSEDELLRLTYKDLTHPNDRRIGEEVFSRFISGELNVFEFEKRYLHKQGHEVTATVKGCAIRNPLGELEYSLGLVQDTTEWKRAEKVLRNQKMMSALGALVANVAHEVRNPLFGISAVLDAFEARHAQDSSLRKYFSAMRVEVSRMNDLMRELLDYGKPVVLDLQMVSAMDVLREALAACLPLARTREIHLRTDLKGSPPPTQFDRRRLYLVFRNLIENAIQYSPVHGTVTIEVSEVRNHNGRWTALNFKDKGPGFGVEDLPRVFEPFFSRRKGGTGLGLAIVKRIVDEHGGTITAGNREEGGAMLTLLLPQKIAAETEGGVQSAVAGG